MEYLNNFFESFASIAWGQPTQLLLRAGLYFAITAKFHPYRYITYAFDILGKTLALVKEKSATIDR